MESIGRPRWAIAEGYIPAWSNGPEPEMTSHETACVLNAGDADAHVTITVFFTDREPAGRYRLTVPTRRTVHQRFNELTDPEPFPVGVPYASVIESDVPVVVQQVIDRLETVAYRTRTPRPLRSSASRWRRWCAGATRSRSAAHGPR